MTPRDVRDALGHEEMPDFPPRYNIAPTQPVALVTEQRGRRHFQLARWAFLPSWVSDPKSFPLIFNARGESLGQKPAFKAAVKRRRCIVPADAFYEWRREGREKTPFMVHMADRGLMPLAGIWETWTGPNGEEVDGAAIVTCTANGTLSAIHERMPVILRGHALDVWLDCEGEDERAALALIRPCPDDWLAVHRLGPRVNRIANDDPAIQAIAGTEPETPRQAPRPAPGDDAQGSLL